MCRVNLSLCFLVFLMGIAFLVAVPSVSQADGADDALSAVSEAALRQDWNGVLSLVEKHPGVLNDPVGRAIAGHAYLATNRNNLSYGIPPRTWSDTPVGPSNSSLQGT
jgi:hypothetical protein